MDAREPAVGLTDWPDQSRWISNFTSQTIHDVENTYRELLSWNEAEKQDLIAQVRAGVHMVEIARRHQRHLATVHYMYLDLLRELEEKLLK